jgi:glycosyltransferase involved in cell wall biosynthesis
VTSPIFTVFTPTYQRAAKLPRVYASLAAQTFRDFEWLIVDDGSTDGTGELVAGWAAEASFPIRYLRQENQGKHVAWNRGVEEARGELFLGLDSDDACVPEALERFHHHWTSIPDADRPGFSAVTALCVDQHGELIGTPFPHDVTDSDPLEIRYRHKVTGEKWGFHRTEVLREFPFPEVSGTAVVAESVVWDRIAHRYRTRYVNERLRIYDVAFDEDSLMTQVHDPARSSAGFLVVFRAQLTEHLGYARHAPLDFVRAGALYTRHALHQGQGPLRQAAELPPRAWPFWVLGAPLGVALYARDRRRAGAGAGTPAQAGSPMPPATPGKVADRPPDDPV